MNGGPSQPRPKSPRARLLFLELAALAAAGFASGCFSGGVGSSCDGEFDCARGLRCYTPQAASSGICTVLCDQDPCQAGVCTRVADGALCTRPCTSSADCSGDATCQETASGEAVCWVDDPSLRPLGGESLGAACAAESQCGIGQRCIQQGSAGLCTELCTAGTCTQGTCATTDSGDLCLKECASQADCPAGSSCRATPDRRSVCWVADSHLQKIPEGIIVGAVQVRSDSNGDGRLNPGEEACVQVYARNTGRTEASGVDASISSQSAGITAWDTWSCDGLPSQAATLAPGETSSAPVLNASISVDDDASPGAATFEVVFEDAEGNSWRDTFTLDVTSTAASVSVARTALRQDSNRDGRLNPGEDACVQIFARNDGTSRVNSVDATISSQSAGITAWDTWSCDGLPSQAATLAPGDTSSAPVLNASISVDEEAMPGTATFEVVFSDAESNTRRDNFSLEVSR